MTHPIGDPTRSGDRLEIAGLGGSQAAPKPRCRVAQRRTPPWDNESLSVTPTHEPDTALDRPVTPTHEPDTALERLATPIHEAITDHGRLGTPTYEAATS